VDVYGPILDANLEDVFRGRRRTVYRGTVDHDHVEATLMKYDALVLPTYHRGEGYPGVIIEAYMAGLPVICSRWQATPEIVDDTSGILVSPRDADALHGAMLRLVADDELYRCVSRGATARAIDFDSGVWTGRFVAMCRSVVRLVKDDGQPSCSYDV
jgi:glycosyltransferase involved in cell wall biosynthesis